MSQLFDKDTDTTGLHKMNTLTEGDLEEAATTGLISVVQQEGKRRIIRTLKFYNLDMVIFNETYGFFASSASILQL